MSVACITIDTEFPDQPAADPLRAFDALLAVLASRNVRATFFIVGAWARAHPDRVRTIADAGHHIGSHSYAHCSLTRLTEQGVVDDLRACDEVLSGLGVTTQPWFRAPYGETADGSRDLEPAIRRAGYRHIHWHARGEDWRPGRSAEDVAKMVLSDVAERWPRPAIILMHSWPDNAASALEMIIDHLTGRGARFVAVDEMRVRHAVAGRLRQATRWPR